MSKIKTHYQCQACGYSTPKWMGKCPDCGQWNSMVEERATPKKDSFKADSLDPIPLDQVSVGTIERTSTRITEFDRVLGGGIVPGSVTLIGGDPGIGKSTLLLQAIASLNGQVLYVSGEESAEQIKIRSDRLSVASHSILIYPETSIEGVLANALKLKPSAIVVDSIQTMYTEDLDSAPGSVGQVRECATKLMFFAKRTGVPVFIIGHVTKEGAIAGPRVLEHIVDTVLYFEGDRGHSYRIMRTVKNRFGSTNEIGVFEMTETGMREIENPSELFLSERPEGVPGSVVVSSIEGTRPLLVEIQALVSPTMFGTPRRTAIGMDYQRVNLLIAVLEKIAGLQLGGMDVFTNVVGGLKLVEPAVDLAVAMALASSLREVPVEPDVFVFGEIGLSGEVRAVNNPEMRIKEAEKTGFKKSIVPATNAAKLRGSFEVEILGVKDITEALDIVGR